MAPDTNKLSYNEQIDRGLELTREITDKKKTKQYGIIICAVLFMEGLTWKGKLVYAALVTYMDKNGECWPSLKTLARKLKIKKDSVIAGIRELEKSRIITVERKRKGKNNLYRINIRLGQKKIVTETTEERYVDFETFWKKYHQITGLPKTDRNDAIKYWKKLSQGEQQKADRNVGAYFNSLRDKNFCKKARTYLSGKTFNDELENVYREPENLITFDDDE